MNHALSVYLTTPKQNVFSWVQIASLSSGKATTSSAYQNELHKYAATMNRWNKSKSTEIVGFEFK